ncbi:hypothetical protein EDB85DRAFT_434624 [Lactarius pseudohatsudake]|nr:hypothetical protein EDB85DRAFT_434624 [Lactarius pseudohatsudake]
MRGTGTIILIPIPQPLSVDHISPPPTPTVRGPTIRIKLGFVYPPNSTGLPDFERIYNALANTVLAPEDKDHVGVVLEISPQMTFRNGPTSLAWGWDMDSFVTKDLNTRLHPNSMPTIREFSLPLTSAKKPGGVCRTIPTITFRAGYQPYDALRKQVE